MQFSSLSNKRRQRMTVEGLASRAEATSMEAHRMFSRCSSDCQCAVHDLSNRPHTLDIRHNPNTIETCVYVENHPRNSIYSSMIVSIELVRLAFSSDLDSFNLWYHPLYGWNSRRSEVP